MTELDQAIMDWDAERQRIIKQLKYAKDRMIKLEGKITYNSNYIDQAINFLEIGLI